MAFMTKRASLCVHPDAVESTSLIEPVPPIGLLAEVTRKLRATREPGLKHTTGGRVAVENKAKDNQNKRPLVEIRLR